MDDHQQWVAAADMLTSARKVDGSNDLPSDDLVDTFRDGLTTACVIPEYTLSDMGAALYVTEKGRFAP
jgi:hypothetical protein